MIDDKKIKSAAQGYCDATYGTLNEHPLIAEAFEQGAKWVINEFLKDLWHPVSEEPKKSIFMLSEYEKGKYYASYFDKNRGGWRNNRLIRWLNIDDLFPKQKGE